MRIYLLLLIIAIYPKLSIGNLASKIVFNVNIIGHSAEPIYLMKNDQVTNQENTIASGQKKISFSCVLPALLSLVYKDVKIPVYLENVGEISVTFESGNLINTINFKGENAAYNNYLILKKKELDQAGFSKLSDIYGLDVNLFIKQNNQLLDKQTRSFEEYFRKKHSSEKFKSFVMTENHYQFLLRKVLYPSYHEYFSKEKVDRSVEYFKLPEALSLNNNVDLLSPAFIDYVSTYCYETTKKKIKYPDTSDVRVVQRQFIGAKLAVINAAIKHKTVHDFFVAKVLNEYLELGFLENYDKYVSTMGKNPYLDILNNKERAMIGLKSGRRAPDFTFIDSLGKSSSLYDYRGKNIFIAVWSVGCHYSIEEIPYYADLMEKYKDNITYINISLEPLQGQTKKFLGDNTKFKGIHGYSGGAGAAFEKAYFITGTPRFIIIGKDGNIINAFAPYPSGPLLEKILAGLN